MPAAMEEDLEPASEQHPVIVLDPVSTERREAAMKRLYEAFLKVDDLWERLVPDGNDAVTGARLSEALSEDGALGDEMGAILATLTGKAVARSAVVEVLCRDGGGKVTRDGFHAQLVIEANLAECFVMVAGDSMSKPQFATLMAQPENQALRELIKQRVPSHGTAGVDYIFHYMDTNRDGMVSLVEFMTALHRNRRALETFQKLDVNGDGFVSPAELAEVLRTEEGRCVLKLFDRAGKGITVEKLFAALDQDGDGKITPPEFLEMLVHGPDFLLDELAEQGCIR
eukprot:TRINITY_DN8660_c0_g1_i1.p1 TRINITY_DN8660_c0_g1~~TRINITY_DN8660_c0_g1_i1.p1  ORF type:complete len:284 (+),score=86.36 TRINITY_DN8660_c0_g1_i1:272-1123(+)